MSNDSNSTSSSSTSAKKRKKDSLSVNLEKLDNLEESKSPNSIKKLKLAKSEPVVMARDSKAKEPIEPANKTLEGIEETRCKTSE